MTTVNRCLDAAKACNVDDVCQKLRTEYVSTCIKPSTKTGLCNRSRCNKALRRFFDRVPPEYTHELLFCPCSDMACSERRRQTIVPSCSYEGEDKASCLSQMRICKADYICRSVSEAWTATNRTGGVIKQLTLHSLFSLGKENLDFSIAVWRNESMHVLLPIRKELFFTFLVIRVCINGHWTDN